MKKLLLALFIFASSIFAMGQNPVRMATTTGVDTYAAAFNPAVTSFNQRTIYVITFGSTNTAAAMTLNPNGAGTTPIKGPTGANLAIGSIVANATYMFRYDGTNLVMVNSGLISTGANNELMMSNGTYLVPSGISKLSSLVYNYGLGTTLTPGLVRMIIAQSSNTNCDIELRGQGTLGNILLHNSAAPDGNFVGIGVIPLRKFHISANYASNGTVEYVMRLNRNSTTGATIGNGSGIEFATRTVAASDKVGATMETITTNVTSGAENFHLAFKTMTAGAAMTEKLRISEKGLILPVVGEGLSVKTGTNASLGTATLAAGTVTVTNTRVTALSVIFLTSQNSGAGSGALRISARTAGTSFVITSTSATDNSIVGWFIVEPN